MRNNLNPKKRNFVPKEAKHEYHFAPNTWTGLSHKLKNWAHDFEAQQNWAVLKSSTETEGKQSLSEPQKCEGTKPERLTVFQKVTDESLFSFINRKKHP